MDFYTFIFYKRKGASSMKRLFYTLTLFLAANLAIIPISFNSAHAVVSNTTVALDQYLGNDLTTTFAVTFPFTVAGDLLVVSTLIATGVDTTQVGGGTDYNVVSTDVVFITAPATGTRITIKRNLDITQLTDYVPNDPFPAETHEAALDKGIQISQQQEEKLGRAFLLPDGTTTDPTTVPEPTASNFLRRNAADDGWEWVALTATGTFANPMSAQGDLMVGDTVGDPKRLAVGAANTLAATDGSDISWRKLADADVSNATLSVEKLKLANFHGALPPDLIVKFVSVSTVDIDWVLGGMFAFTSTEVQYIETGNLTVDITASGANGLDTGAEAGNTWYNIFVIAKSDGTVASLLSLSATAPTMPSGYTFKRRVGAVRNNGSSAFIEFEQFGNRVYYIDIPIALSAGAATPSFTNVDISAHVPPTSREIILNCELEIDHGTAEVRFILQLRGDTTGSPAIRAVVLRTQVVGIKVVAMNEINMTTGAAQIIEYAINAAGSTSQEATLHVNGYIDQI